MSSLKMTFSLASLVLLIAFIAMPVMAHVITPADTNHNPDDDASNPDHALVESITVDTTHLTTTNVITATVTFAAASGTSVPYSADPLVVSVHEIVDPADIISTGSIVMEIKDATTGMFGDASGTRPSVTSVVRSTVPTKDVGAVYTVFIGPAVVATVEGEYRISVDGNGVFTDGDAADGSNAAKAVFIVDTMAPTIPQAIIVEEGPITGIDEDFSIEVIFSEPVMADAIKVEFDPKDKAEDGDAVGSRGTQEGHTTFSIPIELATDLAAAFEGNVTISVSATDAAGNKGVATSITVGLKIAKGIPTPGEADDPHVDITVSNIGERSFRIAIDVIPDGAKGTGKDFTGIAIADINKLLVIKDLNEREIDLALAEEGEPLEDVPPVAGANGYLADVTYSRFADLPLTITVNQDPKTGGLKTSNKDDEWEVSSTTDTSAPVLETIEPTLQNDDTVEFTFTFDKAVPRTGNGAFTAADLTVTGVEELDADGELDDVLLETVDYTVFTLTLTPKPDADGEIEVVVTLKANSVWIVAGNFVATMSATYMPEVETDAPTVTSIVASAPDITSGNVTFTIIFSEAVTGLTLGDLEIENGSAVDFGGSGAMYTVEVDPDAGKKVSVGFKDTAIVTDTTGNALDVTMVDPNPNEVYTPEGYVPTVTITAADGTGDDEGEVIFTLNFIEAPVPFSVASLSVTGAAALKVADLKKAAMADEGYVETYTLTVTPNDAATEVKVSIAAGCTRDNGRQFIF